MKTLFLSEEVDVSLEEHTGIIRKIITEMNRLESENLSLKSDVTVLTEKLERAKDECYELRSLVSQLNNK